MKIEELIPDCLSEEFLQMDLEVFSDMVSDDSYHYAELLRKYHLFLTVLIAAKEKNEKFSKKPSNHRKGEEVDLDVMWRERNALFSR